MQAGLCLVPAAARVMSEVDTHPIQLLSHSKAVVGLWQWCRHLTCYSLFLCSFVPMVWSSSSMQEGFTPLVLAPLVCSHCMGQIAAHNMYSVLTI